MKLYLLPLLGIVVAHFCTAQSNIEIRASRVCEELTKRYNLSKNQQWKTLAKETRKFEMLDEISPLKDQQSALYFQKARAIHEGSRFSFQLLLTKQQQAIFDQQQRIYRKKKAKLLAGLKAENASQTEIEMALLELESRACY